MREGSEKKYAEGCAINERKQEGGAARLRLSRLGDRGGGSRDSMTNVSLSERRSQTDAKPRAISSLLEYCRGAKEEDEVSFLDYAERKKRR